MSNKKENLRIYDALREVPETAKKTITGGRLSGMTNINPMYRIKALTEQFGPFGDGWWYKIIDKRLEKGANDEVTAFVDINLFYRTDKGVSEPLPGTGGSKYISKEKNGFYTDDDCFKKALTDAISVAVKPLGVGGDVYWNEDDGNKYQDLTCKACGGVVRGVKDNRGKEYSAAEFYNSHSGLCLSCVRAEEKTVTVSVDEE